MNLEVVIKIASRCNINCTYCYMYNHGDNSYLKQPKFIENSTINSFIEKVVRYSKKNDIKYLSLTMHGGEPLLMDKQYFIELMEKFHKIKEHDINLELSMQTNGMLIDDEWCEIFKKCEVGIGVSIDGPKNIHDQFRVDKKNKGTFDRVMAGVEYLKKNEIKFGALSVLNTKSDPVEFFEGFKKADITHFDLLLLDKNYDKKDEDNGQTAFEWLKTAFDLWFENPDEQTIDIRIFSSILKVILGSNVDIDSFGTSDNNIMVLETNGEIESLDCLKICGESFTKSGVNIKDKEIEDCFDNLLIEVYKNSGKYLCRKCLACPVQEICGGGYLPHRYSSVNGFNNPTVYCDDLLRIITYIQNKVYDSMSEELKEKTQIQKLTYEEALQIIEETLPSIPEPIYAEKLESFKKHAV